MRALDTNGEHIGCPEIFVRLLTGRIEPDLIGPDWARLGPIGEDSRRQLEMGNRSLESKAAKEKMFR